jgi:hypothetical protein
MKNQVIRNLFIVLIIAILVPMLGCNLNTKPGNQEDDSPTSSINTQQITPFSQQIGPAQTTSKSSTSMPSVPGGTSSKTFSGTVILGSPTDNSMAVSLLTPDNADVYIEYGKSSSNYAWHTGISNLQKDQPLVINISGLERDTQYYYRICHRASGESGFSAGSESTFHTQRASGSTFSFGVQGDSHPERLNKMFDPDLYVRNMNNVIAARPDFYFAMGDDFSIERFFEKNQLTQANVDTVYAYQRNFLGLAGGSSPIFLVNGNHEQAAKYLLDGTPNNGAVMAGNSRLKYYSLPAPGTFYSGDTEEVQYVGLLRDYYAWTWGDALFVVIDPYWHSPVAVDNDAYGGDKRKNMWDITLGDTQYQWFKKTLETSRAKYKFVFTHQVLGTGRGGIELASLWEWGGKNQQGVWEFDNKRPGWEMPVHQLMVKNNVTIFFHAHDHLYAQQELDGIIYQSVPNPADPTYQAFNSDAFKSGKILPNSGFLNVTVSTDQVKVDYINSYLPGDEKIGQKNGQVAYTYTIRK